jgi:PAS domain S-box-containing protein
MSKEEPMLLNKELEEKLQKCTKELEDLEEKFRTIAENSLMGIAIIQDNKIKYINKQAAELTGYSIDETKELNPTILFEFIHPKDRLWVLDQLKKKQVGEKDYLTNYQYRIINKLGEIRWVDNYSRTIDFMGKPADLVSVIDITNHKNAEQSLKESEEMFRTIAEYSDIGITIIQDGSMKYANGAMSRINEHTIEEMMNWTAADLIEQIFFEDREHARNRLMGRLAGKPNIPISDIYRINTKSGKTKLIESYSKTVTYQEKNANLALIMDITEQKLAQEKLKESEERLKFLVTNNPAIIYTSKVAGDYGATFISDNVQKEWGYSSEDIVSNSEFWLNHIHPDDKEHALSAVSDIIEKGRIVVYDYRFKLKDGSYRWMRDEAKLVKDEQGNPIETVGSVIDINERKIAEEKLKESEEKYRHLYENSPFSIVLIDYSGKILDMNNKTTKLFGYEKEDLINKNYFTLTGIYPSDTKPGLRLIPELISKGEPSRLIIKPEPIKIFNKDKKPMWVESELSTVRIGGKLVIQAIIQDITEKKIAEEKLIESEQILRQQNIELKELDRLKTDFISIAAHDLKTPLISVGGYIDLILLRDKGLNGEIKEDLNRVLNNVQRLERYINRLLDVMKIEAKKVELVKKGENIHGIVVECLSELEFQIGQKELIINLDISEKLKLNVDHFRISQTFLNLLSNAVKFTPKNGKIDISFTEEDEGVLFKIKDNGKGMTSEELQKIFGKFMSIEQGVDGYSTMDKGSGLGLYIAKGFIEAHGGKIWATSQGRDLGAEFSFFLPKQ